MEVSKVFCFEVGWLLSIYSLTSFSLFYSIGCIFGELLVKDAILKGNGELDVSNCNLEK